jgi:hypothetical protein
VLAADVKDALTIRPAMPSGNTPPLNPILVLAFVEEVLNYKMVHTNGSVWMYRSS